MSEKSIPFERVKDILRANVPNMVKMATFTFGEPSARIMLVAMGSYLDMKPLRYKHVLDMVARKAREIIDNADVRGVKDILALLPAGYDNRLPKWLYGDVDAYLEENGWMLAPRRPQLTEVA